MESLFAPCPGPRAEDAGVDPLPDDDPTVVLGVEPGADWVTIRQAHRKLLAELHPDRFVSSDERTRQDAADRLGAVNLAYHELEKERRAV